MSLHLSTSLNDTDTLSHSSCPTWILQHLQRGDDKASSLLQLPVNATGCHTTDTHSRVQRAAQNPHKSSQKSVKEESYASCLSTAASKWLNMDSIDVKNRLSSVGFNKVARWFEITEISRKKSSRSGPQLLWRHRFQHNPGVKDTGLETDHTRTGTFTLCPDGPFTSCVYSFS